MSAAAAAAAAPRDPGPRPELTWLPVDRLDIDPAYQRALDTKSGRRAVARIAADFRWDRFQAILAVPAAAGDRWLIIDGQHRVAAARDRGIALVPAVVIHGLDRAGQAAAFVGANRDRVPVAAQAVFHARIAAGEPLALTVARLCAEAGITPLRYGLSASITPAGSTTAAPALCALLKQHGEAIAGAFGATPGALRRIYFVAACRFLVEGGTPGDLRRGLDALGPAGLTALISGKPQNGAAVPLLAAALRAAAQPSTDGTGTGRSAGLARFVDDRRAQADHGSPSKRFGLG